LKKVYKTAKYPLFPTEHTSHFSCITSPLDNLRYKQQLEKVLPVKFSLSGLSAIGKSRLAVESGLGQDAGSHSLQ